VAEYEVGLFPSIEILDNRPVVEKRSHQTTGLGQMLGFHVPDRLVSQVFSTELGHVGFMLRYMIKY
jgi:hypothetical protein